MFIDSREKERKDRAKSFYIAQDHTVTVERLEVGDYVFDEQVVFEYKEISDFLSSIKNESLFNEAANQALKYEYHYVIIVGDVKQYLKSNWLFARRAYNDRYDKYLAHNLAKYYGALRRLRTFTTPIEVSNERQAFDEMLLQSEKCLDGNSKFYANVTRPVLSQNPCEFLLCGVKGVSRRKAENIMEYHQVDNLYDLLSLSVDDFKAVKGIGVVTATNIFEFIHSLK